jgi:hypothetical protein
MYGMLLVSFGYFLLAKVFIFIREEELKKDLGLDYWIHKFDGFFWINSTVTELKLFKSLKESWTRSNFIRGFKLTFPHFIFYIFLLIGHYFFYSIGSF